MDIEIVPMESAEGECADDEALDRQKLSNCIKSLLSELPHRDEKVLRLRYGIGE